MAAGVQAVAQDEKRPAPYQNPQLAVSERVADLLARMTVEEKIGQLQAPLGWEVYRRTGSSVELTPELSRLMKQEPGVLYGVMRADPWTKVTLETGLTPRQSSEAANLIQQAAMARSRLHIPFLLAEECPHGHMAIGATVYPTSLGQASTWDPGLIREMAASIGQETRAVGGNVCYGPILDIAREPRWSRVEETYGEDPWLVSRMGEAFVLGLQGESLKSVDSVAATLKHFAGYGEPEGGHNSGPSHAGPREMETVFLPAFRAGVEAGAVSVMASYNAIDGLPSSANVWLLTDMLRRQWHFEGFVTSDLYAIDGLAENQHVASSLEQAAAEAIDAGLDSDLGATAFAHLDEALKRGLVSRPTLDQAVGRVLRVKFELGLFDAVGVDPDRAAAVVGSQGHRDVALRVARESIVLLKNAGNVLPFRKDLDSVAVIGPNADSVYNQIGDYTAPQPEGKVTTVLAAIRKEVGPKTVVRYARGTTIRGSSEEGFAEALDAVHRSSVAVVVLGGSSARNFKTQFAATGAGEADMAASGSEMESGEGFDRSTLSLAGNQVELLRQVVATGKPVVLVLIMGRPLELNWAAEHVAAILNAWYPGEAGGQAIADVRFGDANPGGKLPISMPRSEGQLPVFYGEKRADYVDGSGSPLFAFGFGLSYSKFEYGGLQASVSKSGRETRVQVSVDVTNTSGRAGDEVVQLYLHPATSSVVVPLELLRGFERIHLGEGEKRTVHFELGMRDLAVFGRENRWVVEAGDFELMVGASSEDIRLRTRVRVGQGIAWE
jgi:beta-glucosidase